MEALMLDVSSWAIAGVETHGATEHLWLRDPSGDDLALWKPAEGRRLQRHEHRAEKVSSALARLLGVPCAAVELAERDRTAGCISRNVQPSGTDWRPGALLLAGLDPTFHPAIRGHAAYTVDNVETVLRGVQRPRGYATALPDGITGFDVFAGYLLFDALVLNRDRHAGNWAVIRPRDGSEPEWLAPLYDNASALAMSLHDESKLRRLDSAGVPAYAARENAARSFARPDGVVATLDDVAAQALQRCGPGAREHWLSRLQALSLAEVGEVVDAIPAMSDAARRFTVAVVDANKRRLIRVCAG